jgi:hypothetical protein
MVLPNGYEQRLRDIWSPIQQRTDKMELDQVVHQVIPWILLVEGYLENGNTPASPKNGLNIYHDF